MGLGEQLTSDERDRWEDFCQRLGASLRATSMQKVLDSCDRNPRLTMATRASANALLVNEMTIIVVHQHRGVLLS